MCLGIVILLSVMRQDHQFNTIIKCYNLLQVNYLQITQQAQPIHIPHNVSLHNHTIRPYRLHLQHLLLSLLTLITHPI